MAFPFWTAHLVIFEISLFIHMSGPPKKSAPGVPTARVLATAVAQYPYNATEDTELGFPEGATINILQRAGDWWRGELNGKVRFRCAFSLFATI